MTARPWAIWIQAYGASSRWVMLGAGYSYSTEQAANRAVERLIADGELRRDTDGVIRSPGLGYRVAVMPKVGHAADG